MNKLTTKHYTLGQLGDFSRRVDNGYIARQVKV